jgi:hypothetical protein
MALNMISPASVEVAVAAIRAIADGVAKLERAVDNLERVERARVQKLRLQLWDHRGVASNGHAKETLR